MKETLASLFKPYHPLGPIVAHRNVRMRGQAFVSFRDKATAALAQRDVNEFPLYGKPIVSVPEAHEGRRVTLPSCLWRCVTGNIADGIASIVGAKKANSRSSTLPRRGVTRSSRSRTARRR